MFNHSQAIISQLFIHHLGNYQENEGITYSDLPVILDEKLQASLKNYFFNNFKEASTNHFTFSDGNIELNPLYVYCRTMFENPESLEDLSKKISQYLYDHSRHPNIKSGDFMVSIVRDVAIDGELLDAICLFKSENKQPFISVEYKNNHIDCTQLYGIHPEKMDKGCVILNTQSEDGYIIFAIDKSNQQKEAEFWVRDFLNIAPRSDDYYHTKNLIQATKAYVDTHVKPLFEIDKGEETGILNRSKDYLQHSESYESGSYAQNVFQEEKLIKGFESFAQEYMEEKNVKIEDQFSINSSAVKNYNKIFKSILKLDKNFHVYIHGDRTKIERGKESDGQKYYKLYYDEEK
jgi:hypothetical protein